MKKMQKIFTLIISFFAMATNESMAQAGFSFSVKATPHFSFLHNETDKDNSRFDRKSMFSAAFGIGAGYNFTQKIGIALDVLYSLQGQEYTLNNTEYKQKLDYIKVPVLFTYSTNPANAVSFIGKIGPQISFLTNAELEDTNLDRITDDTKDRYETATFGGAVLAGAQFRLQPKVFLTTALRFDYDFSNAEDSDYPRYPTGRGKTHNSTAGLEIGIKFLLK
jgi:opacity protein-like surface antigen